MLTLNAKERTVNSAIAVASKWERAASPMKIAMWSWLAKPRPHGPLPLHVKDLVSKVTRALQITTAILKHFAGKYYTNFRAK